MHTSLDFVLNKLQLKTNHTFICTYTNFLIFQVPHFIIYCMYFVFFSGVPRSCWSSGLRKYVFLCTACGSLSILLGALFLTVYFMLKSYTSSLNHFETIPTYVPSGMVSNNIHNNIHILTILYRRF